MQLEAGENTALTPALPRGRPSYRSRWLGACAVCAWLLFAAQATGLMELEALNPLANNLGCAHGAVRGTPPAGISNGITLRFNGQQVDVPRGQLVLVQGKRYTLVGVDPARNSLVLEDLMGMLEIPLADINVLIVPRVRGGARVGVSLGAAAGGAVVGVVVGMIVGGNHAGLDGMLRGCLLGGVIGAATGAVAGVSLTHTSEYGLKDHTWQIELLDKLPPASAQPPAPPPIPPWPDAQPAAPAPPPVVAAPVPAPAPAPRLPLRVVSPPAPSSPAPPLDAPPSSGGLAPVAPPEPAPAVPDAPAAPASSAP
jgi:hypothetical protein